MKTQTGLGGKQRHTPHKNKMLQQKPHDREKPNGPQSPKALKWVGSEKNLQVWGTIWELQCGEYMLRNRSL